MMRRGYPPVMPAYTPDPLITDPLWTPPYAAVGIARNEHEARQVFQLRYRVYIHEQGRRRAEGIDWERGELTDPLDPWSYLWHVRDAEAIVGTIAQTIIGPDFDLSRLPPALELESFHATCLIGFSSRFAIAPDYRGAWVFPSLARYTYAHGRKLGGKFDVMVTNPGLVSLFERLGYVRYTASSIHAKEIGLLIPMVLPATDHAHLRRFRSACLPAAAHFEPEPEWGAWLRTTRPIIGEYYGSDARHEQCARVVARQLHIPLHVAAELTTMSFAHRFPAGAPLLLGGDRVVCAFMPVEGQLGIHQAAIEDEPVTDRSPDGVALSRTAIRCETNALVLCVPIAGLLRLMRRHADHRHALQELMHQAIPLPGR
jgi:GNAT superfamily N-acetyltransferase